MTSLRKDLGPLRRALAGALRLAAPEMLQEQEPPALAPEQLASEAFVMGARRQLEQLHAGREGGPMKVRLAVTMPERLYLLEHVRTAWEAWAQREPTYGAVREDAYRNDRIEENRARYEASGRQVLERLGAACARAKASLEGRNDCLDVGCGTGRVTQHLAARHASVVAIDIAARYRELTEQRMQQLGLKHVRVEAHTWFYDGSAAGAFDVALASGVLESNPPPLMVELVRGLAGALRPGGLGFVDVPTHLPGYGFKSGSYAAKLKAPHEPGGYDRHALPQHQLFKALADANCRVLDVRQRDVPGVLGGCVDEVLFTRRA